LFSLLPLLAILKVRQSGFGSNDSIPADNGARDDQPSERGTMTAPKMISLTVGKQNIIPCCVNQLLTSTSADSVFRIREFELSHISIMGIIRQALIVPN
jgi:replication factor A4